MPWPRGAIKKDQAFTLTDANGGTIPLQSWPLAYWPDGSLKWIGFAAPAGMKKGPFKLSPGGTAASATQMQVSDQEAVVRINTGPLQCIVPKSGGSLIDSLQVNGQVVAGNARMQCILQQGPDGEGLESPEKKMYFSKISKVTLEQQGPVRTVVRIQGTMESEDGERSLFPYIVRLYFYAGSTAIRMVHTIIYDGDQGKDFIKGLGLFAEVPMQGELYNRHVRFSGEGNGIWAEPVKPLMGRGPLTLNGQNVFPGQEAGEPVPGPDQFSARARTMIGHLPVWNDYRLMQPNANGFNIQKRTNSASTWLDANAGERATGLVFAGNVNGGLAVGIKDFWQSYPAALEVRNAATDAAELRVWLWSPYGQAMDMRHYDTVAHDLNATYEDVQKGFSTPYGIARTSELTLYPSAGVPSDDVLAKATLAARRPPLLVASPEYLHSAGVFGEWSLPDRSTPGKQWIEERLSKAIDFYRKEVDQRNWYGFWNYGDVMHAYDPVRHTWRYDIGGFAWDNTELGTVMWLWYSFLRTGDAGIFRMAEAMTRHTSEVDVYHLGRFAGLGSRHNVRHWGDGSKEVRESQAPYHRFYYYLTTDERTGDMMQEVAETADRAMTSTDPLRLILPKTQYPTHARFGPDWLALVGNWMTAWERTGDESWRDKIMAGVKSFAEMPYGFFSGAQGAFGYDPATKKMYMLNDTLGIIHLSVLMGGPEVAFELTGLLEEPAWKKLWLQYCKLYNAPGEEVREAFGKSGRLGDTGHWYARLPAYVFQETGDPEYARRAWDQFLSEQARGLFETRLVNGTSSLKPLEEVPRISTNNTAQWCLNAIELLELAGDEMPEHHALWEQAWEEK